MIIVDHYLGLQTNEIRIVMELVLFRDVAKF